MLQLYIELFESAMKTIIKNETARNIISLLASAVIGFILFLIFIYTII